MKTLRQAAETAIQDIENHMMYRMDEDTVADALHNAITELKEGLKIEAEPISTAMRLKIAAKALCEKIDEMGASPMDWPEHFAVQNILKVEEPATHPCTAVTWSAETGYVFPTNVPDTFELMTHAENYRASVGGNDHWEKREILRGALLRVVDAYREAAKANMPQKAKPDFLEGYEAGMADAKRMMLSFINDNSGLSKIKLTHIKKA